METQNIKNPEACVLPQAIELESSILGQMLISQDAVEMALSMLKPEMFYASKNQLVFKTISYLAHKNVQIDTLIVINELKKNPDFEKNGGVAFVLKLTHSVLSAANIVHHCHCIQEKFFKREIIFASKQIMEDAFNDEDITFSSVETLYDNIYKKIKSRSEPEIAKQIMYKTLHELRDNVNETKQGILSGITKLDKTTNGWQPGDFIIIGARPSVGKTALALQFAINAAESGNKTLFFSLEMTKKELSFRIFANQTGVSSNEIKGNFKSNAHKLWPVCDKVFSDNLLIDESSSHDIYSLRSIIRRQAKNENIKLVVIDYLQLIDGEKVFQSNTNKLIGEICRKLKQTAKELHVPIILLSQLSREVEKRTPPFPLLSDLRDSGEIEQHADMVIFPTRYIRLPEIYHKDEFGNDLSNKAVIHIAKYRNGAIGKFNVEVSSDKSKWVDDSCSSLVE